MTRAIVGLFSAHSDTFVKWLFRRLGNKEESLRVENSELPSAKSSTNDLHYKEDHLCKPKIVADSVLNLVGLQLCLMTNLASDHWELSFDIGYSENFEIN